MTTQAVLERPVDGPDTAPGNYYVSVRNDKGEYRLLLGPFPNDHAAALAEVDKVRLYANQNDPKSVWYFFGTARRDLGESAVQGRFNSVWPVEFLPGTQILARVTQTV